MRVIALHPQFTLEHLGLIPEIIRADDPRPIKEQINERYVHGGGWHPISGFKMINNAGHIKYPGDPVLKPLAKLMLGRSEFVYFYRNAIVAIVQADGSFEAARLD